MTLKKKRFAAIGSLVALTGLSLFVAFSALSPAIATILDVIENTFFTYEDGDGNIFNCYKVTGNNGVAITWGKNPSDTPDGTLVIPETVSDGENNYNVIGIKEGGFRFCDFSAVTIPQTVIDIKEEAFAYCQNITVIDLPHAITRIAPSCFLDCRKLEFVHYTKADGSSSFGNDTITEIGDHAFDSCVSLRDFYCPKSVTVFGQSAFQKCTTLRSFYFPSTIKVNSVVTNPLTVKEYAFADCTNLTFIYFETNMAEVDNYAFVNVNVDARIRYNGPTVPNYTKNGVAQDHWHDFNIATNISDLVPVDTNHPTILVDDECPSIRYTIETTAVKLDAAQNKPTINVIDATEASQGYASIYKFETPNESDRCFNLETKTLTIPDTLNGKTVKVIKEGTFTNNYDIEHIIFNEGLVQIANHAFYGCKNIKSINFGLCENLKEVSYFAFNDSTEAMKNTAVTSLILPDCLQYVGHCAFANFAAVSEFHMSQGMLAIGDAAFFRLGYDLTTPTIDLVLPKTLSDAACKSANFKKLDFWDPIQNKSFQHKQTSRFYSVGRYAFLAANGLKTAIMEEDTSANASNNNYSSSFFSNGFKDCNNLLSFKTNVNVKFIGKDLFKNAKKIKEVFLHTRKSAASGSDNPWGIDEETGKYGGTLFFGVTSDVVCYIDGAKAPGTLDDYSGSASTEQTNIQIGHAWNSETADSYVNQTQKDSGDNNLGNFSRTQVPTYRGVNFDTDIKYWNPSAKAFVTTPDYVNGTIALVKTSSDPVKYSVARYYYSDTDKKGTDFIDLTAITGISDDTNHYLTEIGEEAFAKPDTLSTDNTGRNVQPGGFFVLPQSITKIGERAFYRKTSGDNGNKSYGVRVVTFKDETSKQIYDSDGTTTMSESDFTTRMANIISGSKNGYCTLPSSVTYIGRSAFYNNDFHTVKLPDSLSFIGNAAFYCHSSRSKISDISLGTNSYFTVDSTSKGLYYTGGGDAKKILVYQPAGVSGDTLTIASGTKALGMNCLSGAKYKNVVLPSGLTTIYGVAFSKNTTVQSVTGLNSVRYISSLEDGANKGTWDDTGYTEVWDSTVDEHFNNGEYRNYSYPYRFPIEGQVGAFLDCTALTTFDFTSLTELRKIGVGAFSGDTALVNMCGSNTYTIKNCNSSGVPQEISGYTNTSKNILDLSGCTHLRSIARAAFNNVNNAKYIILPNIKNAAGTESALYFGYDPEAPYQKGGNGAIVANSKGHNILVGETIIYSHPDVGNSSVKNHYPKNVFGSTGNKTYYYVASESDIASGDSTAYKYWTRDGSGNIILFDTAKIVQAYF